MDITIVVKLILVAFATVWTYFLLPWLQTKKTAEERKALAEAIQTAVKAAEQIYTESGKGREKKAYVLQWLREQGVVIDEVAISELIDAMIESSVLDLKKEACYP